VTAWQHVLSNLLSDNRMIFAMLADLKLCTLLAVLRVALQTTGLAKGWQQISSDLLQDTRTIYAMGMNILSALAVDGTLNLGTLLASLRVIALRTTGWWDVMIA
jgi:hypothetical protein